VQQLVDGIARSGKWLEGGMDHRMEAAEAVSRQYYNQRPELLRYVLSKPPDRVTYSNLALHRKDFEQIEARARDAGILDGSVGFNDYADTRFSEKTGDAKPYQWEGAK
jgi:NitT/TauT family transport system substrate-binding protein